jgi:hypothetical protein
LHHISNDESLPRSPTSCIIAGLLAHAKESCQLVKTGTVKDGKLISYSWLVYPWKEFIMPSGLSYSCVSCLRNPNEPSTEEIARKKEC